MISTKDWNGREIELAESRGCVRAVAHPYRNLMRLGPQSGQWPPPEIVQKLYQSRQQMAFDEPDLTHVKGDKGYYCDLQSLHSEDAITWSVFGPVRYAPSELRDRFMDELLGAMNIESDPVCNGLIWLWTRIPHPDALVPGGPEIDFGITTENVVVLGEAKWRSGIGKNQGKNHNKTQIGLRREFAQKLGEEYFGKGRRFVVLSLVRDKSKTGETEETGWSDSVVFKDLTWDQVCAFESHPMKDELMRYLEWKDLHSKD